MPRAFDPYLPKTILTCPDGSALTVGTMACDDPIHQAVYLGFTSPGSPEVGWELAISPDSVEVLIGKLQEYANQARFINGARMLEYRKPYPVVPPGALARKRPSKQCPGRKGRPAGPSTAPREPKGPPSQG